MLHGEIDILPFPDGKILVGATTKITQGFDLVPDEELLNGMYEEACAGLPSLKNAKRSGVRVGTRAYTSDFLPFFGEVPNTTNAFVASGLGSFRAHKRRLDWRIIGPHGSRGRSRIFSRKIHSAKLCTKSVNF